MPPPPCVMMNDGLSLRDYRSRSGRGHPLTRLPAGIASGIGGVGLALIKVFMPLAIVAEKIAKPLGSIHIPIVVIAERDDGGVLVQHPDQYGPTAVPPSVMIDQFLTVGNKQHPPAQAVVSLAGLLKTIPGICAVQDTL